jgi:hypothetical protein
MTPDYADLRAALERLGKGYGSGSGYGDSKGNGGTK